MGCSSDPTKHLAVGSWAPDIYKHIQCSQQKNKESELIKTQLEAGGLRASLWQPNTDGNKCACYKEANEHADRKCKSCHGTGYIPGYLKFGFTTVWMSVVDSDVTLTNCKITTEFKSAKVTLNDSALSGTVESGDKAFTRSISGSTWDYETSTFIRIAGSSTVTVEYSVDSGSTWSNISNLPTANPSSGTIRFKATLTRTSTGVLSPLFEIVRARFERIEYRVELPNGTYRWGPWILVLKDVPGSRYVKTEHGDTPSRMLNFWTVGLSFFDPEIEIGSRDELIGAEDIGPSYFIEVLDGVQQGRRFVIVEKALSDPFAFIIMSQNYVSRNADPVGPYYLIW